jgi:DNA mismatch repair protein MutL
MPRIQQLPPLVVSQIAAGEVIERPASVLKELLENSVDAGSTRVDVAVGQGGLELLRVADNGCGIDAADLPLAFAPHATSKLRCADDLFSIGTLGFRGEGLASIGSVAQVCLQSRTPGSDHGAEVRCHGGDLSAARPWNGSPGTRVEVRHLFYNTPGRRKFLRGPATEMGHVLEVFTRLALSQLSLHLTLTHNGKKVHEVPASAGLLDRVGLFFGDEVARRLLMVEAEQSGMTLGGYVADPLCGWSSGRRTRRRSTAPAS